MNTIIDYIEKEPVAAMALVEAVLAVVVVFGLALSAAQIAAILGLAGAILTIVARKKVTPNKKLAVK